MTTQAAQLPLAGLRTVVTGASSGIGRGIAEAFAGAGAVVGIGYSRSAGAARELQEALGPVHPLLGADLSTPGGCAELADAAFTALGGVDVWVNNAGADILTGDAADEPWERKLDALLDLDLRGTIRLCRLAAPRMADGGVILNMSWDRATTGGEVGVDGELHSAVKAAVLGFSKAFARSVAPRLRVNLLCPGWIETAFGAGADPEVYARIRDETPMERWGRPADVGATAVWLASPGAAYITGQAINVNGGTVG